MSLSVNKYKGVEKTKYGKYRARICTKGRIINIGTFNTYKKAHLAYKKYVYKYHGKFGKLTDITNKKFGRLTVKKYAGVTKNNKAHKWLCLCKCGKMTAVQYGNLKSGSVKSCGCLASELRRKESGYASFNRVYNYYYRNAVRKNQSFSLKKKQFKRIASSLCHYCKAEPKDYFKRENDNGRFLYNGVDRKTNHRGYTLKNSLPCCRICNRAKSDLSYDEFMNYINRLKESHE